MFVAKKREKTYKAYLEAKRTSRRIEKKDENSLRVEVLVLETSSHDPWSNFLGYHIEKADIGSVGGTFALVFLTESKKAQRLHIKSDKILVRR